MITDTYVLTYGDLELEGALLRVPQSILDDIGYPIPDEDLIVLNPSIVEDFVIVTAASDNHFYESWDLIHSAQQTFPGRKIIYYSLGLRWGYKKQLLENNICNLEVREFSFSRFPPHVRIRKHYAWKAIIDFEVLREYPGILWLDASIRFREKASQDLPEVYKFLTDQTDGLALFLSTNHSNYAVTHPDMYRYLPTNTKLHKVEPQLETGAMFLYRTRSIYYGIIKWFVLCGLDQHCWDPYGSTVDCLIKQGMDTYTKYMDCHRYDQATMNILAHNHFRFRKNYFTSPVEIYDPMKESAKNLPLEYC